LPKILALSRDFGGLSRLDNRNPETGSAGLGSPATVRRKSTPALPPWRVPDNQNRGGKSTIDVMTATKVTAEQD